MSVTLGLWMSSTVQLLQKANAHQQLNSPVLTQCNLILISYVTTSFELSPSSSDEQIYVGRESANIPTQRRLTKHKHLLQEKSTVAIK